MRAELFLDAGLISAITKSQNPGGTDRLDEHKMWEHYDIKRDGVDAFHLR